MSNAPCTQDEFGGFFLTTAYDVLGDGGFSKHLKAKSTRGEEWALLLSKQYDTTAEILEELIGSVQAKWGERDSPLADVVNGTTNSLSPPDMPLVEKTRCAITGAACKQGLDVSALVPAHRLSKYGGQVCVDTKYSRFIQMLWVCARLKHIIWCFTTTWFTEFLKGKQAKGKQVKCPTYAEIAEEMAEATKGDAARLYRLFVKAHACVRDAVKEEN